MVRPECVSCREAILAQRDAFFVWRGCSHPAHVSCALRCPQADQPCPLCASVTPADAFQALHELVAAVPRPYRLQDLNGSSVDLSLNKSLTHRPLRAFPRALLDLRGITSLSFDLHGLTELPDVFGEMTTLTDLFLCGNELTHLPPSLCKLVNLRNLYAFGNHLTELPTGLLALPALYECNVSGNQLAGLANIGAPSTLHALKLSTNSLRALPEDIGMCNRLVSLTLNGNCLTELPDSIGLCFELRRLVLSGNQLTALPASLCMLTELVELAVADNRLATWPGPVARLPRLEELWLFGNRLTEVPPDFLPVTACRKVWLERNPLTAACVAALLQSAVLPEVKVTALGLDSDQLAQVADRPAVPCLREGWCPPLGPDGDGQHEGYFKRVSARALKGGAVGDPCEAVVVAFASSQGTPEWAGALAQVHAALGSGAHTNTILTVEDTRWAVNDPAANPDELMAHCWDGWQPAERRPAAPPCPAPGSPGLAGAGPAGADFDILFVCDCHRRWYADAEGSTEPFRQKLQAALQPYRRRFFLGSSMGGFGALSFADEADVTLVFGAQVDLQNGTMRPGLPQPRLAALSRAQLAAVGRAVGQGRAVRVHTGLDQYYRQAQALPPEAPVVVHPLHCQLLSTLLHEHQLLTPILTHSIGAWLRGEPQPSLSTALSLALWRPGPSIALTPMSREVAARLFDKAPKGGDWACRCGFVGLNFARRQRCLRCGGGRAGHQRFLVPMVCGEIRGDDWFCECGALMFGFRHECRRCGAERTDWPRRCRGREGDWVCRCGYLVFRGKRCRQCNAAAAEGDCLAAWAALKPWTRLEELDLLELKRDSTFAPLKARCTAAAAPPTAGGLRVAIAADTGVGDLLFGVVTPDGVFSPLRGRLSSSAFKQRHTIRRSALRDALVACGLWCDAHVGCPARCPKALALPPKDAEGQPLADPTIAVAPSPPSTTPAPDAEPPCWVAACGQSSAGRWYVGRLRNGTVSPATLTGVARWRRFVPRDILRLHALTATNPEELDSDSEEEGDGSASEEEEGGGAPAATSPMDVRGASLGAAPNPPPSAAAISNRFNRVFSEAVANVAVTVPTPPPAINGESCKRQRTEHVP
eukprot:EG_transcript_1359